MTEVLIKSPSSGSGSNILSMQRFQGLQLEPPTRDVSITSKFVRALQLNRFRHRTQPLIAIVRLSSKTIRPLFLKIKLPKYSHIDQENCQNNIYHYLDCLFMAHTLN